MEVDNVISKDPAATAGSEFQNSRDTPRSGHATALLVLGSHRSGVSTLTPVLSLLGADYSANLIEPLPTNQTRHREPVGINHLNEEILPAAGSYWHDWRRINPDWFSSGAAEVFMPRAVQGLAAEYGGSPLFVMKDPRLCRLLPFWLQALAQLGAEVKCVLIVRNPLEVAASLRARDGFAFPKSFLLWLRYVLDAEEASQSLKRVFVHYDDLLNDWRVVAARTAAQIGVVWPNRSASTDIAIDRFIEHRHRHFRFNLEALEQHPDAPVWVRRAYAALLDLCRDSEATGALAVLENVREGFNQASQALGAVLRAEDISRDKSLAESQAELTKVDARAAELERLVVRSQTERESLTTRVQELERDALADAWRAGDLEAALAASQAELAKADTRAAELERLVAAREVRLGTLHHQRDILARALLEIQTSAVWGLAYHSLRLEQRWPRVIRPLALLPKVIYWTVTLRLREHLRLRRRARQLVASGTFDAHGYMATHPEIAGSGWNPVLHRLCVGSEAGPSLTPAAQVGHDSSEPDEAPVRSHQNRAGGGGEALREVDKGTAIAERLLREGAGEPDSWRRPLVLIIDSVYPRPDRDSGSMDAMNHIRIFKQLGLQVVFAADAEFARPTIYLAKLMCEGVPCVTAGSYSSIERFLELRGHRLDVCFLSRVYNGGRYYELVRRHCPAAKIIFNTVDLHFVREERQARLCHDRKAINLAAATRERELYLARAADAAVVVSEYEQALLERDVPGARVVRVPLLRTCPGRTKPFKERAGIGFVGGFLHTPNLDAVTYFLDEIWPAVRRDLPGVKFYVIGSDMPESISRRSDPDMVPVGYVADLGAYLERLRVTVAPLRYGAGAKGKVVSSLAQGVPCVASPVAAEGMNLRPGSEIMLASTPDEFAASLVSLYTDEATWNRISDAGLRLVRDQMSLERGAQILCDLLSELGVPVRTESADRRVQPGSVALTGHPA